MRGREGKKKLEREGEEEGGRGEGEGGRGRGGVGGKEGKRQSEMF